MRWFIYINAMLVLYFHVIELVSTSESKEKGRWQKKAQLSESKKAVNDVKFSPRYLGLKLATASADGTVRIYEASDVFSLNYWPLQVSFGFFSLTNSHFCNTFGFIFLISGFIRGRSGRVRS